MHRTVSFLVNGRPVEAAGAAVFETVANFLRYTLRATGTKLVCEEGDCGACSVMIGRLAPGAPDSATDTILYRPVNSCIQFVYQIHGTHIVTVEGLSRGGELHPVQDAMVRCHGAQCGFCTPGFVVAMCALYEGGQQPDERATRDALTGNLCRCTGYDPIIRAAVSVDAHTVKRLGELYPDAEVAPQLRAFRADPVLVDSETRTFFAPNALEDALQFRRFHPDSIIVQGATDVGVLHNKRDFAPSALLTLSGIDELSAVTEADGVLSIGANVTLTALEDVFRERVPQFRRMLELFGSPQIRHVGTLAGNIANASPIGDSIPFLFVMGAEVELASMAGRRRVPIDSFYLGYKKLDMRGDELIARVHIPLPGADEILALYKVSRRKHLDISTLTAAIRLSPKDGAIGDARVAYGGVGPTVMRLKSTEDVLRGAPVSKETFVAAGQRAREEIRPISDVRGSAEFRRRLAGNIFLKLYAEHIEGARA